MNLLLWVKYYTCPCWLCSLSDPEPSVDWRVRHRGPSASFVLPTALIAAQLWIVLHLQGSLQALLSLCQTPSTNKHTLFLCKCWRLMDRIQCLVRTGTKSLQSLSGWPTKWPFNISSRCFLFSSLPWYSPVHMNLINNSQAGTLQMECLLT